MSNIFVSYLVTCKNEGSSLKQLCDRLYLFKSNAECIILDDYSDNTETLNILKELDILDSTFYKIYKHSLDNNYGAHKNYGKSLCKGSYIFQIDADEIPSESLMQALPLLVEYNPDIELFWLPRVNDFDGVTDKDASTWGWRLTKLDQFFREKIIEKSSYEYIFLKNNNYIIEENPVSLENHISIKYNPPIVNAPDPQGRFFKNIPNLAWNRRLHEKLEGSKLYSYLPPDYEYALFHNKTIKKQIETNIKYNKLFSAQENQGFKHDIH
jgi:hypothetical protein